VNLSSGGLAILVVGALWFLVLLPSFINGEKSKPAFETPERSIRKSVEAKLGVKATKALKAKRSRNYSAVATLIAFGVSALSWADFAATTGSLTPAIVSCVIGLALTGLSIRSHRQYVLLSEGSLKREIPINFTTSKTDDVDLPENRNAWNPDEIPNQKFLRTGSIEIVELAEVVSFDEVKTKSEIDSIDEILRRRRHIG
jgi:hypothetical protein